MYIKQTFDTFIRIYDGLGYITNKANFSDRVCNESGAVLLSVLSRKPQSLDEILQKAVEKFENVSVEDIRGFAIDFYKQLVEDKYVVIADSLEELEKKDAATKFSYKFLKPKTINEDFTPEIKRADETTQVFLEKKFNDKPQLVHLQIELTSKCNERCVHCYIPHENKNTDIPDELFYSVLEQCKNMNLLSLTLSGGEPMSHPHFADFLRKAKEYDFSVSILSNLTLLNDEILKEMKENRLCSVQVSLYSMRPEIHDKITTVPGSFEKTMNSILKLVENDIPLQLSCPIMKENKDDLFAVQDFGNKLKVKVATDWTIMAHYDHTTGNLTHRISIDETKTLIRGMIEHSPSYQNMLLKSDFFENKKAETQWNPDDMLCGVGVSSCCMVANGNVYPCPGWQGYVMGNLYKNSLKEIWEDSPQTQWLRNIRKKDFPKCADCEDSMFCALCMVRNANENPDGNPLKLADHFCKAAKVNHQVVNEWIKNHKSL